MWPFKKSSIKLANYPSLEFIPYHQLKKQNGNIDPYIKEIDVGSSVKLTVFKVNGVVYAFKPSNKKDYTKLLCAKVDNPIVKESASSSITGNCAKGIKEEYIRFIQELENQKKKHNLSEEEVFTNLISKNYKI